MEKIGFCLPGGGARGPYQVGVAKALRELGILPRISVYSGASIGAVNAAFLAADGYDRTEAVWLGMEEHEIRTAEGAFRRIIQENVRIWDKGIYDIGPLRKRLEEQLDFPALRKKRVFVAVSRGGNERQNGPQPFFRSVFRHFVRKENHIEYWRLGPHSDRGIVELLIASCSIPVVFPPVTIDHQKYYDGGVYDNVPIRPLARAGCDVVIVAHLHLFQSVDRKRYPGIRFVEIRHSGSLGGLLNFSPRRVETLIEMGYRDALEQLRKTPVGE